ncbi:MAG: 50S ribosomal protein L25/general stress protein Ctc [Alloprevotella sp.]|uniref:50S ribosomal protein L25/general stress protein Ctc n=1 Tax=Prevotellamassilia timonensis TaxID=1852370 RepID=UPI001D1C636C|nr:50S ribosomal protein L25/general stress protein Ctc [Prevotellamassilia timonensis]MBS7395441.1 50S ribosomal protein L25/general stress protein Ctc [Prevotellamassilia sp.]MCI5508286.1 50S ribosomal protein L25/general stress protein Ctc [Bacteroidales bacterium]MDY2975521.1 50S ribosomal protein L25/general stress protein Ctc [Alloprevotella sp.]MCF2635265.1 50S ribosomal protein L25/general stress protein Ctc [Prevotellamassilia timonensis]MCI6069683.1 50S ribosomal protein L25/general 
MKQITIEGTSRADLGKKATKAVRANGNVPCVLYGEKKDENGKPVAIHFEVSEKQINKLVFTPHIYLVDIKIDGEDHKGIMKEIQFHPVKDNVLHVDFFEVHAEKPIVMGVPIAAKGLADGVRAGGRLMMMIRKLQVRALYENIPEKLDVDVTKLQLGKSINAGQLSYDNLEIITPKEVIVCTVKMTRAAMGAAAAAAKEA